MSKKEDRLGSLLGQFTSASAVPEGDAYFHNKLKEGIHGIAFSPYEEGQKPGDHISEVQIRRRMSIIQPYVKWIRSFSCTEGNELIPQIAHEMGVKTMVGAWIGDDKEKNDIEIDALIRSAKAGHVDIAAVGNEVMYREELEEAELIEYIKRVKRELPNIPVGYVDAYYEFENRPAIVDSCDLVLTNCYPYWEGCHLDYSLLYMKSMYQRALIAARGKKVIITETGWPNEGETFHGAVPSKAGAIQYFLNAQEWSNTEGIELFYFSSFDEAWKTGAEGDVGAFWGLWDKDEQLKF